jgi:AcrR family transcriptional regulator
MAPKTSMKRTSRAEDTRGRIYQTALELFREKGFESTTMRDIAAGAGVALGAAYYYFPSKEAFVLAFYEEMQELRQHELEMVVSKNKTLKARLQAMFEVCFRQFQPNRRFLGALVRHAPDPDDALSPFSKETRAIREKAISNFGRALEGSDFKVPPDLRTYLPTLLWIYQMSLILFWIHDRSPEQQRTQQLTEKSLSLVLNLLKISGLPLMGRIRKVIIELMEAIAPHTQLEATETLG